MSGWIKTDNRARAIVFQRSNCRRLARFINGQKAVERGCPFCPYCRADMRVEKRLLADERK